MQSSNIPSKIPLPFAYAAGSSYKNTIPVASQIGITNGKASLTDGFPPLTFQAISSGGVPPFGADFNGILNEITAIQQWQEAGGFFPYDSAFSTAIGGYPKGAIIQSSSYNGLWVSSVENNTTDPDSSSSAGWTSLAFEGAIGITFTTGTPNYTATPYQAAYPVIILSGTITSNSSLILPAIVGEWIIVNNTTGAFTVTVRTASGTGVYALQGYSTYMYGDGTNINLANSAAVTSFNGRTGSVSLNATDVTNALGYVPLQYGLGVGSQTWRDVTSSRSPGVTYTNTTASPIQVLVTNTTNLGSAWVFSYVNGVAIGIEGSGGSGLTQYSTGNFTVPSGGTYYVTFQNTGSGFGYTWSELA